MNNKDYLTIKEFSERVGISQQAIYKQLNNKLKKYLKVVDNKKMLSIKALAEYSKIENNSTDEQQLLNLLQTTINTLQDQLKEKDKQIANFQKQIDQEQQLRLVTEQKLIAIEREVEQVEQDPEQEPIKKHWWNRKRY